MNSESLKSNFNALLKTYKSDPQRSALEECIQKLNNQSQGREELNSFLKRGRSIVETILMLLDVKKIPHCTVNLIHLCTEAEVFSGPDISYLIEELCRLEWLAHSKMKILQMIPHFISYDIYSNGEILALVRFVFACRDAAETHIKVTAGSLEIRLINEILQRSVHKGSGCDMEGEAHSEAVEEKSRDDSAAESEDARLELRDDEREEKPRGLVVDDSGNIQGVLDFLYGRMVETTDCDLNYFIFRILSYPGILAVISVQEFVRVKFLPMAPVILKNPHKCNWTPVLETVLLLESKSHSLFAEQLSTFYKVLPEYCGGRDVRFLIPVYEVVKQRMKNAGNTDLKAPEEITAMAKSVISGLDPSKKSGQKGLDFIDEMLELYKGDEAFYKKHMGEVADKLRQTQQVSVNTDQIIKNGLSWLASIGDRAMFDKLLSLCPAESLPSIRTEFGAFIGDDRSVLFSRFTPEQQQSVIEEAAHFSIAELEELARYVGIQLIPDLLNNILHKLIEASNVSVLVRLLERVDDFSVFRTLLVKFYVALQKKSDNLVRPASADGKSPSTLSAKRSNQPIINLHGSDKSLEPLKLLRARVEGDPECYAEALYCIERVIRLVNIPNALPLAFDILNLQPDLADEQLSLILLIEGKYIYSMPDASGKELLGFIKRMCTAPDSKTSLYALEAFQSIGQFLVNKGTTMGSNAKCTKCMCKEEVATGQVAVDVGNGIPGPVFWKEFLKAGAYIAKSNRTSVALPAVEYVFSFLFDAFGRMGKEDQQFVERAVFDQLYTITDDDIEQLISQEMTSFIRHYPHGAYLRGYGKYLCDRACKEHTSSKPAFTGTRMRCFSRYSRKTNEPTQLM